MELKGDNPQPSRRFHQDRIQEFLRSYDASDINHDVEVEGAFIQISDDGLPSRQVFLAITKEDFIIVKQETCLPVELKSTIAYRGIDDADLSLEEVIPLPILHFFIIDDRAKRFTICTSLGVIYHFEMCLLDFWSEQLWTKWRQVIAHLTGRADGNFGAISRRTSYVVKVDKKLHQQFEDARKKLGAPCRESLNFIHHPMTFKRVDCIGIQTENGRCNHSFFIGNRHCPVTSSSSNESFDARSMSSDSFLSLSHDSSDHPRKMRHMLPRDRLTFIYTGNEIWRRHVTADHKQLKRSNSMAHIEENIRKESDKTKSSIHCDSSNSKQLQKFRDRFGKVKKNKFGDSTSNICIVGDVDSGPDTDEDDVDMAFDVATQEIKHKDNERNGRFLWSLAKCLVLKKEDVSQLKSNMRKVVADVTFKKLVESQMPLPPSLTDFDPLDVSSHLTYASRRLFLLVTMCDIEMITWSNGVKIPKSVADVLLYNDVIVRTVITETLLNSDGMAGKIRALKFFIRVCTNLLFRHHDFQSLTAILKGLTSLPLYHMDGLWANLFVQEPFTFCHFMAMVQILSSTKMYTAYTTRVNTCRRSDKAFIPWMDHILAHCVSKKTEDEVQSHHSHTLGNILRKIKLFESFKPSKKDVRKTTGEKDDAENSSKSILHKKHNRWSLRGSKRDQVKSKQRVRFDMVDGDNKGVSKTDSEEMKRRAKASWVARTSSIDDIEAHDDDQCDDVDAVINDFSDVKANYIFTDAMSTAAGRKEVFDTSKGNASKADEDIGSAANDFEHHGSKEREVETRFFPRLCHVIKRPEFVGYGFKLALGKERNGKSEYIDKVDNKSPAHEAGLRKHDRIIEVNGRNIENKTHQQVLTRIRRCGDEIKLLVVNRETDHFYKSLGSTVTSSLPEVKYIQSTRPSPDTTENKLEEIPQKEHGQPPATDIKVVVETCDDNNDINDKETKDGDESNKATDGEEFRTLGSSRPHKAPAGRRKSMFEEALETHVTEEEEDAAFEALKASRRVSQDDTRKSAFDLLTVDDDIEYNSPKGNQSKKSIVESIVHLFGGHATSTAKQYSYGGAKRKPSIIDLRDDDDDVPTQHSLTHEQSYVQCSEKVDVVPVRKPDKVKIDDSIRLEIMKMASTHKLTESLSHDRIEHMTCTSHKDHCCLCANKQCIYSDRVSTQVAKYQVKLLEMKTSARCRVKEYLQLVMDVYDCRSDVDILQLSFLFH